MKAIKGFSFSFSFSPSSNKKHEDSKVCASQANTKEEYETFDLMPSASEVYCQPYESKKQNKARIRQEKTRNMEIQQIDPLNSNELAQIILENNMGEYRLENFQKMQSIDKK